MKQVLREYQASAISNLRAKVGLLMQSTPTDRNVGVILVAPTGAGKTTMAAYVCEAAQEKKSKILFLAHRKELIEQASKRLDESGIDHGIIKAGNKRVNNLPVQVASVQTLVRRLHKLDKFNFIIIDECHRTAAKSYMRVLEKLPGAVIIGLTATPYRTDGAGLGGVYQDLVECSSVQELTDMGFLVPAKCFTTPLAPNLAKVKTVAGDYDKGEIERRVDKPELIGDIYEHWSKHAADRTTVIFATSRKHAKHITEMFVENSVACEYLDGETDESERTRILDRLESTETQVVVNVGILTEGWDCPRVSCVVLARPTKSLGLYLQMAGRALRVFPGKGDCIILDHGGNIHNHGLVADPRYFSIEPKSKVKESTVPVSTCNECFATFRGKKCPACGKETKNPIPMELPTQKSGNLVEFKQSVDDIKSRFYKQMLEIQTRQGKALNWAAVQYKVKFGHWPPFKLTGNIWGAKRKHG